MTGKNENEKKKKGTKRENWKTHMNGIKKSKWVYHTYCIQHNCILTLHIC